ncbi:hypothetical protein V8F06_013462, partial [Rhypophila decipiens]
MVDRHSGPSHYDSDSDSEPEFFPGTKATWKHDPNVPAPTFTHNECLVETVISRCTSNPTRMRLTPFLSYMITTCDAAYSMRTLPLNVDNKNEIDMNTPVWSFERFGQSKTRVGAPRGDPDRSHYRTILIGGEHEDSYDPDFWIYNDVVVLHNRDSPLGAKPEEIEVYGYPKADFPPVCWHTATYYVDGPKQYIYLVGGQGHTGHSYDLTCVVNRLDLGSFKMERIETTGYAPPPQSFFGFRRKPKATLLGKNIVFEWAASLNTDDGVGPTRYAFHIPSGGWRTVRLPEGGPRYDRANMTNQNDVGTERPSCARAWAAFWPLRF